MVPVFESDPFVAVRAKLVMLCRMPPLPLTAKRPASRAASTEGVSGRGAVDQEQATHRADMGCFLGDMRVPLLDGIQKTLKDDVYCLQVAEQRNFALAAGVFVQTGT